MLGAKVERCQCRVKRCLCWVPKWRGANGAGEVPVLDAKVER